jgi:hypothetical protein
MFLALALLDKTPAGGLSAMIYLEIPVAVLRLSPGSLYICVFFNSSSLRMWLVLVTLVRLAMPALGNGKQMMCLPYLQSRTSL